MLSEASSQWQIDLSPEALVVRAGDTVLTANALIGWQNLVEKFARLF